VKRILFGVAMLALIAGFAAGLTRILAPSEQVYSVAVVRAGLDKDPHAWAGRVILVRGAIWNVVNLNLISSPAMTGSTPQTALVSLGSVLQRHWINLQRGKGRWIAKTPYYYSAFVSSPAIMKTPLPQLRLLLSPGVRPPIPRLHWPLPATLYNLPLVGAKFADLFPGDDGLTVRMRLSPPHICSSSTAVCPDGVLLAS